MKTVVLTAFAKECLRNIYDYYKGAASPRVANGIKQQIIDAIKTLQAKDIDWQEEELLKSLRKNHRRLVCGNYKIVYYSNEGKVYVTDIFDARQHPSGIAG